MSFGPPTPARAEEVAGGREYLDALVSPIGRAELAVSADRDTVRQWKSPSALPGIPHDLTRSANSSHRYPVRAAKLFLAPAAAGALPSSGGLAACSSVEFPDLPGGTGQVGVIHQRRRIPLFGL